MKTVVLCGGGTAGHIVPNIALIPELKKYFSEIVYLGSKDSMEEKLVSEAGIPFYSINSVKFNRQDLLSNFSVPTKLFKCIKECENLLKEICPDVIFSKGGYASLPVTLSAKKLKIPYCIHESDYTMGLANKVSARKADIVFTSFKPTYKKRNGECVGIPLQKSLFCKDDKKSILKSFNLPDRQTILVTGGSLGSKKLNQTIREALPGLTKKYNVIHLTGGGNLSKESFPHYLQYEFTNEIGKFYKIADVTVCRAGATTLFELKALAKKAILIPLSKQVSRGDQIKNAYEFSKESNYQVILEEELSPELLTKKIEELINTSQTKIHSIQNPTKIIAEKLYEVSLK